MFNNSSLNIGEIGVLQNLKRAALNGLIAEVTGDIKMRLLYSLQDPAESERCLAYKVRIPGYPEIDPRIDWCIKPYQIRRIDENDVTEYKEKQNVCLT